MNIKGCTIGPPGRIRHESWNPSVVAGSFRISEVAETTTLIYVRLTGAVKEQQKYGSNVRD